MPGELLGAARAIGDRLAADAVWHAGRCTWLGDAMEPVHGRWQVVHRTATGDLYAGTAGVAVFLARLWSATGDERHRVTAAGGARQALALAPELPGDSLYGGRTGVASAAAEVGEATDDAALVEAATVLAADVARRGPPPESDLLAGAAGVALGLLDLAGRLGEDRLRSAALDCGTALLERAHEDGPGLWWPAAGAAPQEPGLCGLAHGASGCALALAELGEAAFTQAAARAARHERAWHRREGNGWPDLRERTRDEHADRPPESGVPMWCHGAVGIGLARLRHHERTGAPAVLADAGAAVQQVRTAIGRLPADDPGDDWSLCHGIAGWAELLLAAGETLGQPVLREEARALLRRLVEAQERTGRWESGVLGGGEAPGLMVGMAGTGLVLLRAASEHRLPGAGVLCTAAAA